MCSHLQVIKLHKIRKNTKKAKTDNCKSNQNNNKETKIEYISQAQIEHTTGKGLHSGTSQLDVIIGLNNLR